MKEGGHVQILSNRLGAIVMAACLLVALAFTGQTAMADGGFPANGDNSLTVDASSSTSKKINADIDKANVVVDVYKVADATPDESSVRYDYTLVEPFDSKTFNPAKMDADAWNKLAAAAAKVVTADMEHLTVAADGVSALTLPDDGLYLLMPHGKDVKLEYGKDVIDTLVAPGELHEYTFTPSLVAVPGKKANANGDINTAADAGDWERAVNVVIKPAYESDPEDPDDDDDENDEKKSKSSSSSTKSSSSSSSSSKTVQTGDYTDLLPFYLSMTVSGLLLALIAFGAIRRRLSRRTGDSGEHGR